jgi:hypothetical protein
MLALDARRCCARSSHTEVARSAARRSALNDLMQADP